MIEFSFGYWFLVRKSRPVLVDWTGQWEEMSTLILDRYRPESPWEGLRRWATEEPGGWSSAMVILAVLALFVFLVGG